MHNADYFSLSLHPLFTKICNMKTIKIRVLRFNSDGKTSELYRNAVVLSDDLSFPYEQIISALKVLYPKSESIELNVL